MNIATLSADAILAIKVPEKLFSGPINAKKEYRKLASIWHPDQNPTANPQVFAHIASLWTEAEKKINDDSWMVPGVKRLDTKDGRRFELRFKTSHLFELGEMYVTDTVVAYLINSDFEDLVRSARKHLNFKYTTPKMKEEFSKYVPELLLEAETVDGQQLIVYKKTPDLLLLRDVLDHLKVIPTVHVAWILSTLYNLNCYFKHTGISHNAISPDSYFISPQHHSGAMLGGWWYSTTIGEKLVAVPQRTLLHAPSDLLTTKISVPEIDSNLIKTTGLELLGDIVGSRLIMDVKAGKLPHPILNWLRTPGGSDPVAEYSTWKKKVLIDSFGKPKFHKLELTAGDLYDC